jgi:(p)ppGpp synthase/HD superfamily hydrolase
MAVGYLHDVIEDSNVEADDLRRLGFAEVIVAAVEVLTRRPDEDYDAYINRIIDAHKSDYAIPVKLADLEHNLDLSRLPAVEDRDLKRMVKYATAYARLRLKWKSMKGSDDRAWRDAARPML